MKLPLWLQVSATILLAAFLTLHLFLPSLKVDATTVLLLFLILVVWLLPYLRGVELPGGLKLEFREKFERVEAALTKSKCFREAEPSGAAGPLEQKIDIGGSIRALREELALGPDSIQERAKQDEILALAQLRIELEKKLRERAKTLVAEEEAAKAPLVKIIRLLEEKAIDEEFASALRDLLAICDRAIHGIEPPRDVTVKAIGAGVLVLSLLDRELLRSARH